MDLSPAPCPCRQLELGRCWAADEPSPQLGPSSHRAWPGGRDGGLRQLRVDTVPETSHAALRGWNRPESRPWVSSCLSVTLPVRALRLAETTPQGPWTPSRHRLPA